MYIYIIQFDCFSQPYPTGCLQDLHVLFNCYEHCMVALAGLHVSNHDRILSSGTSDDFRCKVDVVGYEDGILVLNLVCKPN